MNENELKEIAALKSKEYVPLEGFVGIGTGSTVKYLIKLLAEDYRKYSNVTFVPTSAPSISILICPAKLVEVFSPPAFSKSIDSADVGTNVTFEYFL